MFYYRTHSSRAGERPPELDGWVSPSQDANLNEQTIGEYRIVGITPPFIFNPPVSGWVKLAHGWEVASVGAFCATNHAKVSSTFEGIPVILDQPWLLPVILTDKGTRAFKVMYGGADFLPMMTAEQSAALAAAIEIRTCHDSGKWPDMSVKARWAAAIIGLTYCVSPTSLGLVGLSEDLIETTLAVAGGFYAYPSE